MEIVDWRQQNNEGYFRLTSDKAMSFMHWQAPIVWSGYINSFEVRFTQITNISLRREDFDFSSFTWEIQNSIDDIVEAINKKIRKMD